MLANLTKLMYNMEWFRRVPSEGTANLLMASVKETMEYETCILQ